MTISENLETFQGKKIRDYNPETGIEEPEVYAYRIRLDYDAYDSGQEITSLLEAFYHDPASPKVQELIIGAYDYESSTDSSEIVDSLVKAQYQLPGLKFLFIGDITFEEAEISWIQQSDVSPVWKAYPNLEYFRVRGGNGLILGELNHPNLKYLIVETGGLPTNVIEEVGRAQLPALEHLELWLGSTNYGFEATTEDLAPILKGENFPKLKYLGLRDSEIADELAEALQGAAILQRLETLDLSLGILSDKGSQALLANPAIKNLEFLDLHHHYLSDAVMAQMQALGIEADLSEQQDGENEEDRYIAVSE